MYRFSGFLEGALFAQGAPDLEETTDGDAAVEDDLETAQRAEAAASRV